MLFRQFDKLQTNKNTKKIFLKLNYSFEYDDNPKKKMVYKHI